MRGIVTSSAESGREARARWQKEQLRKHNDVGPPPKVANPQRRAAGKKSLLSFLRNYFDDSVFYRRFGPAHLELIGQIENAVFAGGNIVVAMPRGSGKTTILQRAVVWAALNGHSAYPVLVTGDDITFMRLLKGIKVLLETTQPILDDFPEVMHPIIKIGGNAIAANYQTCNGEPTYLKWSAASGLQFPHTEYSVAAGNASVAIGGGGLTSSRLRGCVQTLPDGRQLRPDLVLVDDPSTRESAKSLSQNTMREDIIKSDIGRMGGPGRKMSVLVALTVIYQDDLASRLLDAKRSPSFVPIRKKMIEAFPSNMSLWDEYGNLRKREEIGEEPDGAAHQYYSAHRKMMDAGCVHYWPDRIEDGFLSAIESAMSMYIEDPRAFASECQNEPEEDLESDLAVLEPMELIERRNPFGKDALPPGIEVITAGIDCQEYAQFWTVCGFTKNMGCYVLDFGCWPKQPLDYFKYDWVKKRGKTLEKAYPDCDRLTAFRTGLSDLVKALAGKRYQRRDGGYQQIELGLVDARFQPVEVEAALYHARLSGWVPSYGVGIGAKGEPLKPRNKDTGTQGLHWVAQVPASGRLLRSLFIDVNYWKTELHKGLSCPQQSAEAIQLPAFPSSVVQMFAESMCSEVSTLVEAKGRRVNEWQLKHSTLDNHYLDTMVQCLVAASCRGINKGSVNESYGHKRPKRSNRDDERKRPGPEASRGGGWE